MVRAPKSVSPASQPSLINGSAPKEFRFFLRLTFVVAIPEQDSWAAAVSAISGSEKKQYRRAKNVGV
jgi:hypothetical protein